MTTAVNTGLEDQIKKMEDRIVERLENSMDKRFKMIDQQFSAMNSRMRELENNDRDISSISNAVRRMNVGFQEIPYELNGRAAVEEIKDYY